MNSKTISRIVLFVIALITASSTHAFWGVVLDKLTDAITDAASGRRRASSKLRKSLIKTPNSLLRKTSSPTLSSIVKSTTATMPGALVL